LRWAGIDATASATVAAALHAGTITAIFWSSGAVAVTAEGYAARASRRHRTVGLGGGRRRARDPPVRRGALPGRPLLGRGGATPEPGPRPVEGHAAVAQADPGVVADDDMVEQLDVEEPAGGEGLGREVEVVR
jgi:hypothetical protein